MGENEDTTNPTSDAADRPILTPGLSTTGGNGSVDVHEKNKNPGRNGDVRISLLPAAPGPPVDLEQVNRAVVLAQSELKMRQLRELGDPSRPPSGNTTSRNDSGEAWKVAERRNRGRKLLVGTNSACGAIQTVPRLASLHVTRLSPCTEAADLENLLRTEFPDVVCEGLQSKHPTIYKSFKVTVRQDSLHRAWRRDIWPSGALVSRFMDRKRTSYRENQP